MLQIQVEHMFAEHNCTLARNLYKGKQVDQ